MILKLGIHLGSIAPFKGLSPFKAVQSGLTFDSMLGAVIYRFRNTSLYMLLHRSTARDYLFQPPVGNILSREPYVRRKSS